MKRTLGKKGIVDVLMSTDGVRFARGVKEGTSLCQAWRATRGKAGAFAYAGRERQRLEPSLTRGEREAKAGAFAYAGRERGKGWSLHLREEREAKAGAFAYTAMQGFTGPALLSEPGRA
jgi:hypothetical protein